MVPSLRNMSQLQCESCELSKHSRASLPLSSRSNANKQIDVAHSDVWGPLAVQIELSSSIIYCLLMNIAV